MSKKAVCVSCFHYYDHRLGLVEELLKEEGYTCTYITSDFDHIKKEHFTLNIPGCIQIPTKPYYKNLSVDRLMSHDRFARDVFRQVEQIQPDLLMVMAPPNSLAKCAARYRRNHPEVKLILDIYDLWPETFPNNKAKKLLAIPFGFWRRLRDKALPFADLVTTECEMYHETLRRSCSAEKLYTLYLAKTGGVSLPVPHPPEDKISLCYLGSINNIIDIPCIGEIIKGLDRSVELHIIGDGEKSEELIQTAEAAGANVIFHGAVYDQRKKQDIFDKCHCGLNIMKDSVCVGLTMKSMDYFEASLPIINTIKGDTWSFVEQYPIGINYVRGMALDSERIYQIQKDRKQVRIFFERFFSKDAFLKTMSGILRKLSEEG